ncbi:tetratricopeptide repeat protein [Streptomyces sp. KL2]|uniref:tetratricopeptide repeat protein n=1 Tax=Streptomyces sp. KL2 TaxID=3050126 RepID=UPI00397D5265
MTDQAVHTGGPAPSAGAVDGGGAAGGLLGRRRELDRLRADAGRAGLDALSGSPSARCRVLLIAGRPGSGRTALAEEFARQAAADYPDGILRARLSDPDGTPVPTERTARDLLRALAAARGTAGEPLAAPPAGAGDVELAEALRAALADRRALLLLDDVAAPEQLHGLLPDGRGCLVLAVSRGPLTGIPDVRPCTLEGLGTEAAVALLEKRAGDTPRVTVDPRAAESLAEACGGRPAALVLVGGWLAAHPTASVAEAARRFGALPDDLPGGAADDAHAPEDASGRVPGGHFGGLPGGLPSGLPGPARAAVPGPRARSAAVSRPLVRAFHLVHGSLPPSAARFLRLLALAPAGLADAHTASALTGCRADEAAATLEAFTGLGLLRTTATPGLYAVPGCLAPVLTAVLEERERPQDVRLARARVLERSARLLRSCRAAAEPPGSPARRAAAELPRALRFESRAAAAAWLGPRLPGLRAAARAAVADGELDTLVRRLAAGLAGALIAHLGHEAAAPELYRLHELLLPVTERRGLHGERAAILLDLGDLDAHAGRPHRALTRYRGALEAARADGGRGGDRSAAAYARALESLGDTYAHLGDDRRAGDWYGRALALCQTRGEPADEARLHGLIGAAHLREGRWEEALRAWRACAAACRRLRDGEAYARALEEVARVQEYAGRGEEARRTRRRALRWGRPGAVRGDGGAARGGETGTGGGARSRPAVARWMLEGASRTAESGGRPAK